MSMTDAEIAHRTLPCLDLTDLGDTSAAEDVEALCARALASPIRPASVCVWPKYVRVAAEALAKTGVRVATVINFPAGGEHLNYVMGETEQAGFDGASEVDVVMPYRAFAEGRAVAAERILRGVRAAARARKMKVILETGMLREPALIRRAADCAIACGADFLKTSTGKVDTGATPEAARVLFEAAKTSGKPVGVKISGGVRTLADARTYLELADAEMGEKWVSPDTFRIGASALMAALQQALGPQDQPVATGAAQSAPGGY